MSDPSPFQDIRDHAGPPEESGFTVIYLATHLDDPGMIADWVEGGRRFTHQRDPEAGNLTHALCLAKVATPPIFEAFHKNGGIFTDQTDDVGRNAGTIIRERLEEARAHFQQATEPRKRDEWQETVLILEDSVRVYEGCVAAQGGLLHVEEQKDPLRPSPSEASPDQAAP